MSSSHFIGGYTCVIKVGNHPGYYLKPFKTTPAGARKDATYVRKQIRAYEKAVGKPKAKVTATLYQFGADWRLHRVGVTKKRHVRRKRRTSRPAQWITRRRTSRR